MGNQFGFEQLVPFLERVDIGQGANLLSLLFILSETPTSSYVSVSVYMYVYFDGTTK